VGGRGVEATELRDKGCRGNRVGGRGVEATGWRDRGVEATGWGDRGCRCNRVGAEQRGGGLRQQGGVRGGWAIVGIEATGWTIEGVEATGWTEWRRGNRMGRRWGGGEQGEKVTGWAIVGVEATGWTIEGVEATGWTEWSRGDKVGRMGGGGMQCQHGEDKKASSKSTILFICKKCKKHTGTAVHRPGRVWLVTSRLGTGKSLTFFYSV
jgi:hypothetical protein